METWLKWLIAAACCVVIAGGGLFAFERYSAWASARSEEQRIADERERARLEAQRRDECLQELSLPGDRLEAVGDCLQTASLNQSDIQNYLEGLKEIGKHTGRASLCASAVSYLRSYDLMEDPDHGWSVEYLTGHINDCLRLNIFSAADIEPVKHRF